MYYTQGTGSAAIKNLNDFFVSTNKDNSIASFYRLKSPFQLHFTTFRPEDHESIYLAAIISPDHSIYFSQSREEFMPYLSNPMHHHDYYELLFVLEGEVYQNIENRRHLYPIGSCCLLNKKVQHTEEYSTDFRAVFLHLSDSFIHELYRNLTFNYFKIEQEHTPTLLEEFLVANLFKHGSDTKNYIDFIPVKDNPWIIRNVHNIFERISIESLTPSLGSSSVIMELFCKFFRYLNSAENYTTTPVQIGTDAENKIYDLVTEAMTQANGRISRQELSSSLHYSGVYLNNIVKKYTGLSIYDYGMTFCMKKTAELLSCSNLSISDIAASMGFTNRTHFYKLFQETYHMSPYEYRKTHSSVLGAAPFH